MKSFDETFFGSKTKNLITSQVFFFFLYYLGIAQQRTYLGIAQQRREFLKNGFNEASNYDKLRHIHCTYIWNDTI